MRGCVSDSQGSDSGSDTVVGVSAYKFIDSQFGPEGVRV